MTFLAEQRTLRRHVAHLIWKVKSWARWRLPALVWRREEVWVRVTFSEDRLRSFEIVGGDEATAFERAQAQLNRGALPDIERRFCDLGIEFDKGLGCEGRDWEWDWSLKGPIKVKFMGKGPRK